MKKNKDSTEWDLTPYSKQQLQKLEAIQGMYFQTPLLRVDVLDEGVERHFYAKYEGFQMTGSIKDRLAYYVFKEAYEQNKLTETTKIVEVTSGNTGIALAALAAYLGHDITIILPDFMSKERFTLLESYGAQILTTSGDSAFLDGVEKAKELEQKGYYFIDQFSSKSNISAHKYTTGPEILEACNQLGLTLDYIVSGVGSGGTSAGLYAFFTEEKHPCHYVLVEPLKSPSLTERKMTIPKHKIQGIGDGFIPEIIDVEAYDKIITLCDDEAERTMISICRKGISVGISSGANTIAAVELLRQNEDAVVMTVFADTHLRYLSTVPFLDEKNSKISIQNITVAHRF